RENRLPSDTSPTAQAIDDEIRKLLAEAHERVRQTLTAKRSQLDVLAKLLQEKEVVDRAMLDTLLSAPAPGEAPMRKAAFVAVAASDESAPLGATRS
ncbi:MAG TPA: hypothetical protein VF814_04550, partial [Casimicrobiaceae bacterium]